MEKILRWFLLGIIALVFAYGAAVVVEVAYIQFLISKNTEIGDRLVESLQGEFPGATFRRAATKNDRVYITVADGVDIADRPAVVRSLRAQKDDRWLAPEIWLIFAPDDDGENRIRI